MSFTFAKLGLFLAIRKFVASPKVGIFQFYALRDRCQSMGALLCIFATNCVTLH
ncbi:hypothetical protein GCWU000325_00794 [Alloprevotella tannerae ATCC 51259]|uniref:Uncharacterized protein n=1 Tax=Alloprevotella tannerae ATCC 51259 TaxID=626522 RepID=C9LF14_9BACT|nr:hypothetical protein GCWU000325_00794 [Alloprevotella tannerae ATCC 51259]